MSERVGVIGAGNWGTALANLLARKGEDVVIWSYEPDVAHAINREHLNPRYLRGITLDRRLRACASVRDAVQNAQWVISVSPAQHVRAVLKQAVASMDAKAQVVSASKGIEMTTLASMDRVLADILPPTLPAPVFLSGPSFALEVARELPTAVTAASRDPAAAQRAQRLFQAPYFRVYTSPDVTGVELGGALKNVIALAAGMAVGLGLGHNALAALITRGLAEMARLGVALGADPLTFAGLAGMGDLILTCTGELSRNRTVGVELGRGRALDEILTGMDTVAEGISTARAAHALAQKHGIEMPIVSQVHAVLFEHVSARDAVETLMLREPKPEQWT
jgi:glycerol-3-phosphate dehydrogenase (NAD(P)+)